MASVQDELNRMGGSSGGSDDQIFDAAVDRHFAKGGAPGKPPAPRGADAPRGRGKRAPQWAGTSTGRGRGSGETFKPSAQQLKALLPDAGSTSVQAGLESGSERPAPKRKTADEIRAEARARNPESWERAERMRSQNHSQRVEASADRAEILARRWDEALQSGNWAATVALGRQFAEAAPQAFQARLEQMDEAVYSEYDQAGFDVDDDEYPTDPNMPSVLLGNAIRDSLTQVRAQEQLARAQAKIQGITAMNLDTFDRGLRDLGFNGQDRESVEEYLALKEYIGASTGVDVSQVALEDPETAVEWISKASAQLSGWDSELRRHALTEEIKAVGTGSVAEGLRTGEDDRDALLREANELKRLELGLGPAGEPEPPMFDPEFQLPESEEEDFQTVGEFRRSVVEPAETDVKSGFTMNGQSVSMDEAARNPEAEQQAAEAARAATAFL